MVCVVVLLSWPTIAAVIGPARSSLAMAVQSPTSRIIPERRPIRLQRFHYSQDLTLFVELEYESFCMTSYCLLSLTLAKVASNKEEVVSCIANNKVIQGYRQTKRSPLI